MSFREIDPNARPPRRPRRSRVPRPEGWNPVGAEGSGVGAWHDRHGTRRRLDRVAAEALAADLPPREVDVLVIGGGQAGLCVAHELQEAGFHGYAPRLGRHSNGHREPAPTYLVLDDQDAPGGAWQHRWTGLTMSTVTQVAHLPGADPAQGDPSEPARVGLARYFTEYEDTFDLAVQRPVRVHTVTRLDDAPDSPLRVLTDAGVFHARAVVAATGTWGRPFWPAAAGTAPFTGRQLHTVDYDGPEDFTRRRVVVVGGGLSAVEHVLELSGTAKSVCWCTRREPDFRDEPFEEWAARKAERVENAVRESAEQGLPLRSVVSHTGLPATEEIVQGRRSGVLTARPMFSRIEAHGVRWANGAFYEADVILWATGFRGDLPYLRDLHVRTAQGGMRLHGTEVVDEPRLHLVGLGPDSSTDNARRSAQQAVAAIARRLDVADDEA